MDSYTVAQLTHILSEEAQMISDELKNNPQNMSPDIIAAKLDGLVLRMKQELRNKGPDTTAYEFPIYQNSHRASYIYPDSTTNYLYDKRYNEAAYPSVRQTQPKLSLIDSKSKPLAKVKSISSTLSSYPPANRPAVDWRFVTPYATYRDIPRKSIDEHSSIISDSIHYLPKEKKSRSYSISHSTANQDSKPLRNSKSQKIVVTVINEHSSKTATSPEKQDIEPARTKSQKSILKTNASEKNKGNVTLNTVRTIRNTVTGLETVEDIFEDMTDDNKPQRSRTRPRRERVTIIDRRDSKSSERKHSKSRKERLRPSKTHPATSSIVPVRAISDYIIQPPPYFSPPPPVTYPEQKSYPAIQRFSYPISPQFTNANTFYPFIYYQY
ncbi:unnamed protein product [Adineta ricciae]|uniref:Uncharacterized protein n=2 Tax=Adineta ricciae TaxID=249248 RepID=A0A813XXU2_ADIRI|nr:unnamed protein product [Adineta ricciae]CAF1083422.1 unnamed protein product [Adineta ricciae]